MAPAASSLERIPSSARPQRRPIRRVKASVAMPPRSQPPIPANRGQIATGLLPREIAKPASQEDRPADTQKGIGPKDRPPVVAEQDELRRHGRSQGAAGAPSQREDAIGHGPARKRDPQAIDPRR